MCGIAGGFWHGKHEGDSTVVQRIDAAVQALQHRGPNARSWHEHRAAGGVVALGHARLSVIDLSEQANQPMYTADRRFGIVFNGEIYNYRELRDELIQLGHQFSSESDTEVLLAAWQEWGAECLPKLVGMFAFVIFDKAANNLICVRDAFGIKPFFYTWEKNDFLFASEISAIKKLKRERINLNWQRAYDYLNYGDYDSMPESFIAGVHHLMPGHFLKINTVTGAITNSQAWWTPQIDECRPIKFADAAAQLREKFLESVRLHLRSDVPLGAALSGGIDSSAIACAIRHLQPEVPIHTFSYIATDKKISEEHWVDKVNAHINAIPHKVQVDAQELAQDIEDMIRAQGEPFGSTSIYAQYRVFKLARECGMTVMLDGQGADELLAGYHGYPGSRIKSLLDNHEYTRAIRFFANWKKNRSLLYGIKSIAADFSKGSLHTLLRRFNGQANTPTWLNTTILAEGGVHLSHPRYHSPYDKKGRRLVSRLAFASTQRGLPGLLRHGDRNSMRFSIESRVPFSSNDLADFLLSLPEHYLISDQGETKSLFRAAMRGIVPDVILDRKDKIGFETPEKTWLHSIERQVKKWLTQETRLPFINQEKMLQEFSLIMANKRTFDWRVWRWINFICWYNMMFD